MVARAPQSNLTYNNYDYSSLQFKAAAHVASLMRLIAEKLSGLLKASNFIIIVVQLAWVSLKSGYSRQHQGKVEVEHLWLQGKRLNKHACQQGIL